MGTISTFCALFRPPEAVAPLPIIERQAATGTEKVIVIDPEYVRQQAPSIVKDQDLSPYIL